MALTFPDSLTAISAGSLLDFVMRFEPVPPFVVKLWLKLAPRLSSITSSVAPSNSGVWLTTRSISLAVELAKLVSAGLKRALNLALELGVKV